jgi:hypothetical protein
LLNRSEYHHKDEKSLLNGSGLVYPASPENIKDRLC